jgi:RNA polymerase sigma-70 factor (sigma-E family)
MRRDHEREFREYAAARLVALRRTAYLICGDWHAAEDAASTVLVKVFQRWSALRDLDNLDGYVRTMLVHAVTDQRRRPWRRRETPSADPGMLAHVGHDDDTPPADPVHDRLVLQAALGRLSRGQRAVLVLRFFEDLSVDQTAATLGCSVGTVKSQTARGLQALRGLLPEEYLRQDGPPAREAGAW